jgi:NAD(P)-dependent dehydrogenase (short-subunit alcohol dehydrogenase family)
MPKIARPLTGRVVAITGGARGIGRATAKSLIAKGAKIAIGDVDLETAQRTAEELGGGTLAFALDVTDRDSFAAFLDQVEERIGSLDVLINNAGIMPLARFEDESWETTQRQLDINVWGVMVGSRLALQRMIPRRSGHIVNVASMAGKAPFANGATYVATKHAVVGLTGSLWLENRDRGIDFSCVMPTAVNTELGAGLGESRAGKKVEPEDVAEAIVEALETGRVEVFVPRNLAVIGRIVNLLPTKAQVAMSKALKADQVLSGADMNARKAYEDRAARDVTGRKADSDDRETVETS